MTKRVAILQSSYIPWKGVFDLINMVDEFVIYDIVQYTKNDFRNRNKIVINGKPTWMTIPVRQKKLDQRIDETEVADRRWATKHWRSINQAYAKRKGFEQYGPAIGRLYDDLKDEQLLTNINVRFIMLLCDLMRIGTPIRSASEFELPQNRVERIISICKALNADTYLSGPAAKAYLEPAVLARESLDLEWMDYSGYPAYAQGTEEFQHGVSVLDLLLNEGEDFAGFMKTLTHPT